MTDDRMDGVFQLPEALAHSLSHAISEVDAAQSPTNHVVHPWRGGWIRISPGGMVTYHLPDTEIENFKQLVRSILPLAQLAVGTDEVGVGEPLGPVVVAGVLLPYELAPDLLCSGMRDSKRVNPEEVPRLAQAVRDAALATHVEILEPANLNASAPKDGQARFAGEWLSSAHIRAVEALLPKVPAGHTPAVRLGLSNRRFFTERVLACPWAANVSFDWRPHAEAWPEVAAASLLATETRLKWFQEMDREGYQLGSRTLQEVAQLSEHDRLAKMDLLRKAVDKAKATGFFAIRPFVPEDRPHIERILVDVLQKYYPTIAAWARGTGKKPGIFDRLLSKETWCLVATAGTDVAGFAIVTPRGARVAKLNTFYILPRFRGRQIGSRLLNQVINAWPERGFDRMYVTLASEERGFFIPFFGKFGFLVDGIQPQRYRKDSYEIIMGRTSLLQMVPADHFASFVRKFLFELRGFQVTGLTATDFLAESKLQLLGLFGDPIPTRYFVRLFSEPDLKPGTLRVLAEDAAQHGALGVLICNHGLKSKPQRKDMVILDAYDVESIFYPLRLVRDPDPAWIVPIRAEYADQLIPRRHQATLEAVKLQLSTENVYYRRADRVNRLRRGATLLWYVSDDGAIRGESKLVHWVVDSPRVLAHRLGPKGAWTQRDIELHVGPGERALAMLFDWYKEYANPVDRDSVRGLIPGFNPITMVELTEKQALEIRRLGTSQELSSY